MLIYDIEIKNAIPSSKEPRLEGINYCKGWTDHAGMGISVIGCYDYDSDRYRVFLDDNLQEFLALLANHKVCVGFNSIGFDNRVILENCPSDEVRMGLSNYFKIASYDILTEIWRALGLNPDKFYSGTHGGYGLEVMCETNFGTKKSGNGALAPVDWQQGRLGKVIDYCLNDVVLTKQLLDKIIKDGFVKSPKGGFIEKIRKPNGEF